MSPHSGIFSCTESASYKSSELLSVLLFSLLLSYVYRETVQQNENYETEKTENYGETVVLSAGQTEGPASLVSREPGELATIYLDRDLMDR